MYRTVQLAIDIMYRSVHTPSMISRRAPFRHTSTMRRAWIAFYPDATWF